MQPDDKTDRAVSNGRVACASLIEQVTAQVCREPLPSADELTESAGHAFEDYAEALLQNLLTAETAVSAVSAVSNDAWIRRQFSEGLDVAGAALRQVLAECCYRHTVSQGLQRKMFEAETRLRAALKSRRPAAETPRAAVS